MTQAGDFENPVQAFATLSLQNYLQRTSLVIKEALCSFDSGIFLHLFAF